MLSWNRVFFAVLVAVMAYGQAEEVVDDDDDEMPRAAPMTNPDCGTVYDLFREFPTKYTIMQSAIDATLGQSVFDVNRLAATVFIPTDDAFVQTLENGSNRITAEEALTDLQTLTAIVRNHVVPSETMTLSDMEENTCYKTMENECLYASLSDEGDVVIKSSGADTEATVLEFSNVNMGCPSIIHTIDKILLPASIQSQNV